MKAIRNQKIKSRILISIPLMLMMPVTYADWGVGLELDNELDRYEKDKKSDVNALLGLNIEYRGDKFNMDKNALSYGFIDNKNYAIEAILKSKNRGFESNDRKLFTGLSERRDSIDLGVRAILNTKIGPVVLDVTRDFHASKGHDADLRFGGITPHNRHWTGKRELMLAPVVGVRYQSKKVVDYHYGVKSSEVTTLRAGYKGESATTPYIGIESQMNLNKHFTINAGLIYERRDDSIRKSSLTNDKDNDVQGHLGVTYWF